MDSSVMANFKESLTVLVSGMGGIFVVLLLIYLLIKGLIKVFPEK
jgi:Na+-transporting methylmalonyl-CoA/oxaloacetate decarboxylase gamma subunit